MNKSLEQNNFIIVPNFINNQRAKLLEKQFFELEELGKCVKDDQSPLSSSTHNYLPFLELLCEKTHEMNTLIGEPVLPTYTYARIYKNNDVLAKHKDRAACEISVSINLGGDASWTLGIEKPNGQNAHIDLNVGDAMIYLGCVANHWRNDSFTGQNYVQAFLHYVRSRGPNAWAFFDSQF
jgi:alkylated DNA repair dioxygenase AlkB